MPAPRSDLKRQRLRSIIDALQAHAHSVRELAQALRIPERTISDDLKALRTAFPGQVHAEATGCSDVRRRYRWRGAMPHLLAEPPTTLSRNESLALVVARGLLRSGDDDEDSDDYHGPLARALNGLIARCQLEDFASDIVPNTISISRFGVPSENPQVLLACLAATLDHEALCFAYRNLHGESKTVHAAPLRMRLVAGAWICVAWSGGQIKNYKVARMREAQTCQDQPPGLPAHIPQRDIDHALRDAFGATATSTRQRVTLAISPEAWPHIDGRCWGADQHIHHHPADLPKDWSRLDFVTSGLHECRHWVLAFGASVRAEGPEELVVWVQEQAKQILAHHNQGAT